jgi:ubiquinone/menaquinone biosynthesis C-methylase UbiE
MKQMELDLGARLGAQATWNNLACGEKERDKNRVEYFETVAQTRYREHPWMREYYAYDTFGERNILEIGVGQGIDLVSFAKAGAHCCGVDITDKHLELTQRNFALRGLAVRLYKADATKLPFPDNSFDCVYSMGVIHHVPEAHLVIQEVRRVLVPGGLFLVAVYHKRSAFHILEKVFANGLRNGWLFQKGYNGLLATIEGGADGVNIKPYVKLYSRSSLRKLLSGFHIDDLSIHQLDASHLWPPVLRNMARNKISALESTVGRYLTSKARVRK